ncbi:MAG: hypothetical protein P9L94_01530 [Candidatus Hinthialibacter antarcticus]|nr:hypothetical protein [Candidatus Hinthialibacter antarcticus]
MNRFLATLFSTSSGTLRVVCASENADECEAMIGALLTRSTSRML